MQIERKLAPFWRPIQVDPSDLTDAQVVAVARGLPIPDADAPLPADLLRPQSPASPSQSTQSLSLAVPGGQATPSAAGPSSSSTNVASSLPATSTNPLQPQRQSRAKAIAGVFSQVRSRNSSQTDVAPREAALPHEPFVDGRPLEVVLYRNSDDCPICFSTYPPYLNYTRCCGNPICSECFVQIKRPDPHVPEHHGEAGSENTADQPARETHNMLVSEPAVCPYCTQIEFGVTYEPPPFRRGLVSASNSLSHLWSSTAMSSQTSLQSATPPTSPATPGSTRRRTQSLSVNAPGVITTDRIRPDWATKLAAQRNTQARRAAAATALHQAAFIMYSGDRQFGFGRPGRFMRRGTGGSGSNSVLVPDAPATSGAALGSSPPTGPEPGPRTSSGPGQTMTENDRLQQFEEIMLAEAIRLSIAAEEERRRKEEKEAKKEARKKEKEERKASKRGSVYGGDGQASSSRSSLSLGFGRRRGNSGSSLRAEATVQGAIAATSSTSVEGGNDSSPTGTGASGHDDTDSGPNITEQSGPNDKGKAVDRSPPPSQPIAMSSRGPSHLRQTSNISSLSSSPMDSPIGSYTDRLSPNDQRASAFSVGRSEDGEGAGTESMFNFRSMASNLGIDLDRPQERDEETEASQGSNTTASDPEATQVEASVSTLQPENSTGSAAPAVRIVPASSDTKEQSPIKGVGPTQDEPRRVEA